MHCLIETYLSKVVELCVFSNNRNSIVIHIIAQGGSDPMAMPVGVRVMSCTNLPVPYSIYHIYPAPK